MDNSLTFEIEADEIETFLQDVKRASANYGDWHPAIGARGRPDALHSVFRAAHTLKAVAGTVGHHSMAELTHTMETLFDAMREGQVGLSLKTGDELLAAIDVLKALRDEVVTRQPSGIDVTPVLARLRGPMERALSCQWRKGRDIPSTCGPPSCIAFASGDERGRANVGTGSQAKGCHEQGYTILEIQAVTEAGTFALPPVSCRPLWLWRKWAISLPQRPRRTICSTNRRAIVYGCSSRLEPIRMPLKRC